MKSFLVLMIGAVALNVAYGLQGPNYEAPMNCRGSEAAARPQKGRWYCAQVSKALLSTNIEDGLFECACALSSHNFWYKKITSEPIRLMAVIFDETFNSHLDEAIRKEYRTDALLYGLYDQVEFLKRLDAPTKTSFLESVYTKLAPKNTAQSSIMPTVSSLLGQGENVAKKTCQDLLNNEEMKKFILPSLDTIKKHFYSSENAYRGLIVSVPELSRLIGVANLCQNLMGIQAN